MGSRRTSIFENGLIWFGAGVSLAEILTGTYFASLGFSRNLQYCELGMASHYRRIDHYLDSGRN